MTGQIAVRQTSERCWVTIGVWGERSCPKLSEFKHCRNCDVYSREGQQLLDRPPPPNYLEDWTRILAREKVTQSVTAPYATFRIGLSWLALDAELLIEIKPPSAIRSLPHASSSILLGVTAVRGEILLCASLHHLIKDGDLLRSSDMTRFIVTRYQGNGWVFPVDEMSGVHDFDARSIEALPATLAHADVVYTKGMVQLGDRSVGLIDEHLLFSSLARMIV